MPAFVPTEEVPVQARRKIALAAVAGVVIGAAAASVTHARPAQDPPGYVVAEVEVTDPVGMKKYGEKVPATLAPFHYRYLVRAQPQALEGDPPRGIVVIAFDSVAKAKQWYESPAYSAIIPLRQSAAKTRMYLVEGIAEP
jgi:uncharacterized protein (DUF1330 family)